MNRLRRKLEQRFADPTNESNSNQTDVTARRRATFTVVEAERLAALLDQCLSHLPKPLARSVRAESAALRGLAAAKRAAPPTGRPRLAYVVTEPDGRSHAVQGLEAVCILTGKARSTIANALTSGGGAAQFPKRDANGNPSFVTVARQKLTEN